MTLTTARKPAHERLGRHAATASRSAGCGQMGRATQLLLGSLDQGLELTAGSSSYVFLGSRFLPGWAIELVLIAMLCRS